MATITGVSADRREVLCKYLSEPILAEASAYGTSYYPAVLKGVLDVVAASLNCGLLTSPRGDRGELAAAAAFGLVADHIRVRGVTLDSYDGCGHNLSHAIDAHEFLKAVVNNDFVCEELSSFQIN